MRTAEEILETVTVNGTREITELRALQAMEEYAEQFRKPLETYRQKASECMWDLDAWLGWVNEKEKLLNEVKELREKVKEYASQFKKEIDWEKLRKEFYSICVKDGYSFTVYPHDVFEWFKKKLE